MSEQVLVERDHNQWIDLDGFGVDHPVLTKFHEAQATVGRRVLVLNADRLAKRLNFQPAGLLGQALR